MPSDSLVSDGKGADDHNLSSRAIGLDCLWIAKVANDHEVSPRVIGLAVSG